MYKCIERERERIRYEYTHIPNRFDISRELDSQVPFCRKVRFFLALPPFTLYSLSLSPNCYYLLLLYYYYIIIFFRYDCDPINM